MSASLEAIFDDREMQSLLSTIKDRFRNNAQANKQLATIVFARVEKNVIHHFNTQSGPTGKWKAWSTAYRSHMNRIGKGGNLILTDTAKMRRGLRVAPTQPSDGILFWNPSKTSSGFPYAKAHDEGGPKLPQRKFMWISDPTLESIAGDLLEWTTDKSL